MRKNINKHKIALQRIKLRHEGLVTITNKRNESNLDNMNERDLRRIYGKDYKKNDTSNLSELNNKNSKFNLENSYYENVLNCNKIGVLIVNLNNINYTKKCIDSLNKQTNKNFIIYLVDQCSDEIGTDLFLNECIKKNINVIKNKTNIPLNHVWNKFKEITNCEFLCFLNNDVVVSPNFIDDTINVLNNDNDIGIAIHVTNNINYSCMNSNLNYKILNPPRYQGWDFTIRRELYPNIPEELLIFGGDDYIFSKICSENYKIALIYSSPILHYKEKTRCNITNIQNIHLNDINNFRKIINNENLTIVTSTTDDGTCNKYPPINFKLNQNKKCVYTACIGDYDNLSLINNKLSDWDYYCFTDNRNLTSDVWKIIYIENNNKSLHDNTKLARYYKTNFYNYLYSYDVILWVDSRIKINCDLNIYLLNLDDNTDIVFLEHKEAKSIKDEFNRVLNLKLEKNEIIEQIKNRYSEYKYMYDNGLIASGVLLYKNNTETVNFFYEWWNEIKNYSNRDQLSANFVLWNNKNIKYKMLPNILGNEFKQNQRRTKRLTYE